MAASDEHTAQDRVRSASDRIKNLQEVLGGDIAAVLDGIHGALGASQTCTARAQDRAEQPRLELGVLAEVMETTFGRGAAAAKGGVGTSYDDEVGFQRRWASDAVRQFDRSVVMAEAVLEELDGASRHVRRARGGLLDIETGQDQAGEVVAVLTARTEALQEVIEAARPIAQAASHDLADVRALAQRQSETAGLGVLPRPEELNWGVVRAGQDARHLSTVMDAVEVSANRSRREATRTIQQVAQGRLRAEDRRGLDTAATAGPAPAARGR